MEYFVLLLFLFLFFITIYVMNNEFDILKNQNEIKALKKRLSRLERKLCGKNAKDKN